jgi:hypothetical protein
MDPMNDTFTITVAAYNIPAVEREIAQLAKLASKLGVPAPTATIVSREPFEEKISETKRRAGYVPRLIDAVQYEISAAVVQVSAKHQLIGKIAHDIAGTDVREVPGFTIDPSFRTRQHCDHCNKIRRRGKYVVFADVATGTQLQVGSTCVKDFVGHSPERLLGWLDMVQSLRAHDDVNSEYDDTNDSFGSGGSRGLVLYSRELVIGGTIQQVTNHGFISRRKMQEVLDSNPTATIVTTAIEVTDQVYNHYRHDQYHKKLIVAQHHIDAIDPFTQWVNTKDTTETFWFNVNQAVNNTGVAFRQIAYIAAAVAMWRRETSQIAERPARLVSEYFGNVGDRVELSNLTIQRTMTFGSSFGPVHMVIATAESGVVFTWTSTTKSAHDLKQDAVISLKGSIKEHREYKGTKQTVLTRCKVVYK